jgi:tripartite-type tricarboxylate transporter receptor subunit TctC
MHGWTRAWAGLALAGVVLATHAPAAALDFPTRPIQIVVPYAPGGAVDTVARLIQQGLADRLGQAVLVVNRTGGGTIIGTQSVARAAPDGHTLVLASVPLVANYSLYKEMPYQQSDFAPVIMLTNAPSVFVVNPTLPVKTIADMVAYIKARPGEVNYASYGLGSSPHLATLQFAALIGANLVHIPYKGGAPSAVAVMAGEVQMVFSTALSVGGGIEGGKLRPLGVASRERMRMLPAVPTFIESGIPFTNGAWFGLLAPAGTPEPIVRRLYDVTRDVMERPEVRDTIENSGAELFLMGPEEFGRYLGEETRMWNRLLSGIAAERQ